MSDTVSVVAEQAEEHLQALVAPLQAERDRLTTARELVVAELRDIDAALRRLDRVIRAAEGETQERIEKKRKSVSDTTVEKVQLAMIDSERMTVSEIAERVGLATTTVANAIGKLRERDQVRLLGVRSVKKGIAPREYQLI